jgi:two-component system, sensor histidine kinase and response regulator
VMNDPITADSGRLRILLAEDNPVTQLAVSAMLRRRGHEVAVVKNGKEALEISRKERFNVLLLDVHLDQEDELKALASFRAEKGGRFVKPPIIGLTSHALDLVEHERLASCFDAYIAQPIEGDDLDIALGAMKSQDTAEPARTPTSIFEREQALQHLGGDEEFLYELVTMFLLDTPKQLDRIRRAIQSGEGLAAARAAHSLKGSLSHFVSLEFIAPLIELELAGKAGELATAARRLHLLEAMMGDLAATMRAELGIPQGEPHSGAEF